MIPVGKKEVGGYQSAFAPIHSQSTFLFQPTPSPPPSLPRTASASPPYSPTDPTSPSPPPPPSTSSVSSSSSFCTIPGCCVCESEGPVATEFSSTSWTAILKLVLSVLHYHHSKQDYFANNIITHFVKTHWDKISGSKKWNADWKSRISDCLSHNSKCFDSSERGKWRLKDRQHVEETIMRMKDKDREWKRTREQVVSPMSGVQLSNSGSSGSVGSAPSPPPVPSLSPLNLRGSLDMEELSYMDATYTSPRSPKKQRISTDGTSMSLSSSSGLSPRINALTIVQQEITPRTTLSPRSHSPKISPRSGSGSSTPRSGTISPRGSTASPRSGASLGQGLNSSSPRTSLLHYAQHMNSPVFPFTPTTQQISTPSSSLSTSSSASSSMCSSLGSPTSQDGGLFTLPPLEVYTNKQYQYNTAIIKEDAPTITITTHTPHHPHPHPPPRMSSMDPSSPSGRVPLLNLTGEEQMARARWTDYRTSQDRMTVDRFLTVVPSG